MASAEQEFAELYARQAPAAFRRARRLLGTDIDAQLAVHDVFTELREQPEQYVGERHMSTYLYGAVTNAALSRLRKWRARDETQRERDAAREATGERDRRAVSDRDALLRSLFARMPALMAEVAVYQYMDELTRAEIGRVIGHAGPDVDDLLDALAAWLREQGFGAMKIERSRPEACPSDLVLDAYLGSELEPKVATQVERHLSHCARCQAQRAAFDGAHAAFLRELPTFAALRKRAVAAQPVRKAPAGERKRNLAGLAVALGAIAFFCMLSLRPWEAAPGASDAHAPQLTFSVARAERVVPGSSGMVVYAGDQLRFAYSTEREAFFALLHVDGHRAGVYYPSPTANGSAPALRGGASTPAQAQRVHAGHAVALDAPVSIDDRVGAERLLALFCRAPLSLAPLLSSLAASGALPTGLDCRVQEIALDKQPATRG